VGLTTKQKFRKQFDRFWNQWPKRLSPFLTSTVAIARRYRRWVAVVEVFVTLFVDILDHFDSFLLSRGPGSSQIRIALLMLQTKLHSGLNCNGAWVHQHRPPRTENSASPAVRCLLNTTRIVEGEKNYSMSRSSSCLFDLLVLSRVVQENYSPWHIP